MLQMDGIHTIIMLKLLLNLVFFIFSIFWTFFFLLIKSIKIFFLKISNNIEDESKSYIYIILLLNLLPIPSGDFFNNWVNIILYLPIGFFLYLNEKKYNFIVINFFRVINPYSGASEVSYNFLKIFHQKIKS